MKNKKLFTVCITCCVFIFVACFFLSNVSSFEKEPAAAQKPVADAVASAVNESKEPVDEHAGHDHAPVHKPKEPVDEHAGNNHAPVKAHKDHVDEHAGHNHEPKEQHKNNQ